MGSCVPKGPPRLIPWSWASFWLSLVHWGHSGTLVLIIFFSGHFPENLNFFGNVPSPSHVSGLVWDVPHSGRMPKITGGTALTFSWEEVEVMPSGTLWDRGFPWACGQERLGSQTFAALVHRKSSTQRHAPCANRVPNHLSSTRGGVPPMIFGLSLIHISEPTRPY